MVIGTEIMTINNELSMSKSALHAIRIAYERWMRQGAKNNRISLQSQIQGECLRVICVNMNSELTSFFTDVFGVDRLYFLRLFSSLL